MTIDEDKLEELERCAEAATYDDWEKHTSTSGYCILTGHKPLPDKGPGWSTHDVEVCQIKSKALREEVEWDESDRNACHIAAADPPTVLELVKEIRRLREERDRYQQALVDIYHGMHPGQGARDVAEEALEDTDE